MPSSCITSKIETPDFPLRVWKIQKEGGSRLTESVSQDERMPRREMKCVPSSWGEMRTQLHPSLPNLILKTKYMLKTFAKEKQKPDFAKVRTLCDPVDCSPPNSSIYGILQARILEWVAISFSMGSSRPRDQTQVSCIAGRCFNL